MKPRPESPEKTTESARCVEKTEASTLVHSPRHSAVSVTESTAEPVSMAAEKTSAPNLNGAIVALTASIERAIEAGQWAIVERLTGQLDQLLTLAHVPIAIAPSENEKTADTEASPVLRVVK